MMNVHYLTALLGISENLFIHAVKNVIKLVVCAWCC